jgi:integrase
VRKVRLVARRKGSRCWYCNFTVSGRRYRQCLDTEDAAVAEILASAIRHEALIGKISGKRPEMTLSAAFARYRIEHAQFLPSADSIKLYSRVLQARKALGPDILLSELTPGAVASMAARMRATLANGSINRYLGHLRSVCIMGRDVWRVAVAEIEWRKLFLDEPAEREHVLSHDEERALFDALRPDFHALVRFALVTGMRLDNCLTLTWRQVDFDAGIIRFLVKSKKPGGAVHVIPITPAVTAIIAGERGRHETRVFTYVAQRNRAGEQRKGERHPFTHDGWRKAWGEALAAAGIADFRFHDLRHTAATRALHAHKNLKTVQRMLGHKDIKTTLRYTRSDVADVRSAMEAVEASQARVAAVKREGGT